MASRVMVSGGRATSLLPAQPARDRLWLLLVPASLALVALARLPRLSARQVFSICKLYPWDCESSTLTVSNASARQARKPAVASRTRNPRARRA